MKLEYAPEAIADIQETRRYIATVLKNPSAASRIVKMISDNCKQRKTHPQLGMSVAARTGLPSDLRFLICENWLVFYQVNDELVQVVRVIDARTDYVHLLFEN